METTHQEQNTIKWNDFLEVNEQEDFEFRLLDDGLGFHHQERVEPKKVKSPRVAKVAPKKPTSGLRTTTSGRKTLPTIPDLGGRPIRTKTISKKSSISKRMDSVALPEVSLPELQTGYSEPVQNKELKRSPLKVKSNEKVQQKKVIKRKVKLATAEARIGAFILDLMFLAAAFILFTIAGSFTVGTTVENFAQTLARPEYLPLMASLMGAMYVFYFSLMDCDQSVGKKILNIKVVDKDKKKNARFIPNMTRAFLSLLIIPSVLNLQDSLTDTDVVQCSN